MSDYMIKAKKILVAVIESKTTQAENCQDGIEHEYVFLSHVDGRDQFTNVFECKHCEDMIVRHHMRTGRNKELWSDGGM